MMGIISGFALSFRFGLGAVIALIHDVLVTIGALMLANYEFDLTIVAALLTLLVFGQRHGDRLRSYARKHAQGQTRKS